MDPDISSSLPPYVTAAVAPFPYSLPLVVEKRDFPSSSLLPQSDGVAFFFESFLFPFTLQRASIGFGNGIASPPSKRLLSCYFPFKSIATFFFLRQCFAGIEEVLPFHRSHFYLFFLFRGPRIFPPRLAYPRPPSSPSFSRPPNSKFSLFFPPIKRVFFLSWHFGVRCRISTASFSYAVLSIFSSNAAPLFPTPPS